MGLVWAVSPTCLSCTACGRVVCPHESEASSSHELLLACAASTVYTGAVCRVLTSAVSKHVLSVVTLGQLVQAVFWRGQVFHGPIYQLQQVLQQCVGQSFTSLIKVDTMGAIHVPSARVYVDQPADTHTRIVSVMRHGTYNGQARSTEPEGARSCDSEGAGSWYGVPQHVALQASSSKCSACASARCHRRVQILGSFQDRGHTDQHPQEFNYGWLCRRTPYIPSIRRFIIYSAETRQLASSIRGLTSGRQHQPAAA
jgi:hypothetical protein